MTNSPADLILLLPLAMSIFLTYFGLTYLFRPEATWRMTQNRLRRAGIITTAHTEAFERRRVLAGLMALTFGIVFFAMFISYSTRAPLVPPPPTDGVFVTPTPLRR